MRHTRPPTFSTLDALTEILTNLISPRVAVAVTAAAILAHRRQSPAHDRRRLDHAAATGREVHRNRARRSSHRTTHATLITSSEPLRDLVIRTAAGVMLVAPQRAS